VAKAKFQTLVANVTREIQNEETKWLGNVSVEKYLQLISTWADHKLSINQPCYKIAKTVSTTLEVINCSTV